MAKLFKTPVFLLLAAFLLIAEANHHDDHKKKSHKHDDDDHDDHDGDHDDNSDDDSGVLPKFNLQLKGIIPKFRGNGGGSGGGGGSGSEGGSASSSGDEGCKCHDAKLREAIKKVTTLYRAYASKELAPELKSVFSKLTDFTMNYLAKEKPEEVNKFHNFLQNSAKKTGGAIAEVGGLAVH